jgi:hypothetical protein
MCILLICLFNDAINILDCIASYGFVNCKEVARAYLRSPTGILLKGLQKTLKMSATFRALTAVIDQNVVLWVMTQCSLVGIHRHSEENAASILPFNHEDGGSMFL